MINNHPGSIQKAAKHYCTEIRVGVESDSESKGWGPSHVELVQGILYTSRKLMILMDKNGEPMLETITE